MRCRVRLVWIILALVSGASVAPIASAQEASAPAPSSEARKQASGHFTQGVALFEEGAFRAALIEFERAYSIAPDYRLLYNIGQAQLELHDWLHATQSYERYLLEGGANVPADRRREVDENLSLLASRVGRLSIHVNVQDAEVFVDDQRAGVAPLPTTVAVNLGQHRVFARTQVGTSAEKVVDVAGGELVDVFLELAPASALRGDASLPASGAPPKESFSLLQRAAIGTWIAVAPALAGALATGLVAKNKQDDLDAELEIIPATDDSKKKAADLSDSVRTLSITSDVLSGISAALAVTGVVLWVTGTKKKKKDARAMHERTRLGWRVGPGTAQLTGQF
jgi:hypothetical protein